MSPRSNRAGFTFIEITIASALASLLFLLFSQSFSSSSSVATGAHTRLQAHDTARRSMDALCNVLRGAAWESFDNLDASGASGAPVFQRAEGVTTAGAMVLGPVERIEWRGDAQPADGVNQAGSLVHVRDGVETVIAPRVPQGGFRVQRDGSSLRLTLTTWHGTGASGVTNVTIEGVVALRN